MPERVVMSWNQDIYEVAGHFLAETFGLPRSKEWIKHYLSVLPLDKLQKVDIETTNLAGNFQHLKAFVIKSMKRRCFLCTRWYSNGLSSNKTTWCHD